MEDAQSGFGLEQTERYRWMFVFSVEGDLRFISHQDTLRLYRRALVRASVPVRYSEGFNPHPRIALPLPRPVGVASQAEALVVETETWIGPEEALSRLERHTPAGIRMISARRLQPGERPLPDVVRYEFDVEDRSPEELEARVGLILESDVLEVKRQGPKDAVPRLVNVRPFIADLGVDGEAVVFTLRVTEAGTAKPAEIAGLFGYDPSSINHRIRRTAVRWRS